MGSSRALENIVFYKMNRQPKSKGKPTDYKQLATFGLSWKTGVNMPNMELSNHAGTQAPHSSNRLRLRWLWPMEHDNVANPGHQVAAGFFGQ